jgi:hypothetical protein
MKKIPFVVIAAVIILLSLAVLLFFVFRKPTPVQKVQQTSDLSNNARMFIVSLDEQNKSGQKGTAIFLEEPGGKVKVTINTTGGDFHKETQPAHVHLGSCPKPGEVKHKLLNLLSGASETILEVSIDELLTSGEMAVNIHKSDKEMSSYTACGNLPKVE